MAVRFAFIGSLVRTKRAYDLSHRFSRVRSCESQERRLRALTRRPLDIGQHIDLDRQPHSDASCLPLSGDTTSTSQPLTHKSSLWTGVLGATALLQPLTPCQDRTAAPTSFPNRSPYTPRSMVLDTTSVDEVTVRIQKLRALHLAGSGTHTSGRTPGIAGLQSSNRT